MESFNHWNSNVVMVTTLQLSASALIVIIEIRGATGSRGWSRWLSLSFPKHLQYKWQFMTVFFQALLYSTHIPMFTVLDPLCLCSTGRRCHGAHTAYEKNNRYAARSPRWCGGTSPALLFRMCCVSTAYQWRMGDAHAAHMAYEWRCHCVWCRVWELDHCVFTAQVAYAQRTSHERAAVNAILWRMAGVCIAHGLRTCRTYEYTS